ncbi:MAG: hypothetical protein QMC85_04870 [Methanocellales archaeon]|nr:hypothetical protein [Methanocellales archaeon]
MRNVFKVKIGHGDLDLIPCFAAAGIESAEVRSDQIRVTYAGLAGAGVAVVMCRGLAKGVKEVEYLHGVAETSSEGQRSSCRNM